MERKTPFVQGEYYHLYNRGIEKRPIFQEDKDWKRFQHLLYLCNSENPVVFKTIQGSPLEVSRGKKLVSIVAYSLMSNHFHLIAREDSLGGLSKFLEKLLTGYSMYFNKKYQRSGGLFCKPSRTKHINTDQYFRWVISYIHLNPLDIYNKSWKQKAQTELAGATNFLKSFSYSSYPDYFPGGRQEEGIVAKSALPIDISELEKMENMTKCLFQGSPLENGDKLIQGIFDGDKLYSKHE